MGLVDMEVTRVSLTDDSPAVVIVGCCSCFLFLATRSDTLWLHGDNDGNYFGGLAVRHLDLTRLSQSQNSFVTDKDA